MHMYTEHRIGECAFLCIGHLESSLMVGVCMYVCVCMYACIFEGFARVRDETCAIVTFLYLPLLFGFTYIAI